LLVAAKPRDRDVTDHVISPSTNAVTVSNARGHNRLATKRRPINDIKNPHFTSHAINNRRRRQNIFTIKYSSPPIVQTPSLTQINISLKCT